MHYVFDDAGELAALGFAPCKAEIANPINSELNTLRPTLANHLLKSAERNVKNQRKSVKIFEFGSVFSEDGEQSERFGFVASGLTKEPSLLNGAKPADIDFLGFATAVRNAIGEFELKACDDVKYLSEFEQAKIYQNGVCVGYIGRVDVRVEAARDLPRTYLCEREFENDVSGCSSSFRHFEHQLHIGVVGCWRFVALRFHDGLAAFFQLSEKHFSGKQRF